MGAGLKLVNKRYASLCRSPNYLGASLFVQNRRRELAILLGLLHLCAYLPKHARRGEDVTHGGTECGTCSRLINCRETNVVLFKEESILVMPR